MTQPVVIRGATIIDGIASQPIVGRAIRIENGRIQEISPDAGRNAPASATVVDASGKYVIPGLLDANVHLLLDIRMETLVRYEGRYPELILEAAQLSLKNGVTTVFDTWGPRQALQDVRDAIDRGAATGSRIFCAGNIIGLDGPFSVDFNARALEAASEALARRINSLWVENVGPDLSWMTPDQVAEEVRAYATKGIDFIKFAASEHRGSEPSAFLLFSPLVQARIVAEAHAAGLTAQAHTSSVEALRVAIEAGCDLIQHVNVTGPVPIPQSTFELLAHRGIGAVVLPFTQRRLDAVLKRVEPAVRRYFSTVDENCRNLVRSGATLLLSTDAGVHPHEAFADPVFKNSWMASGEDNLAELGEGHFNWFKAMEEKGLPAMEALKAATRNIAVAYGKEHDLGTLAPGKVADLLILGRNPLEAAEHYRSIEHVMKDGAFVARDTLPEKPVLTLPSAAPCEPDRGYGRFATSRYPACC